MANQNPELDRRLPKGLEPSVRRMDPFPWYETMRRTEPVRYDEERERWDVFGYDDVKRVLSDYETFSSAELSDFDPFGSLGTVLVDENPPEYSPSVASSTSTSDREISNPSVRRFGPSPTTNSTRRSTAVPTST